MIQSHCSPSPKKKRDEETKAKKESSLCLLREIEISLFLFLSAAFIFLQSCLSSFCNGFSSNRDSLDRSEARLQIAEARERLHGRRSRRDSVRCRLWKARQRPLLLRPIQFQAQDESCPLPRRQGRVSALPFSLLLSLIQFFLGLFCLVLQLVGISGMNEAVFFLNSVEFGSWVFVLFGFG